MAICRRRLGGFLDAGDEIGRVDGVWLLRIFNSMEIKKNPEIFISATVPVIAKSSSKLTAWLGAREP
jgi:hypothetical protein